MLMSARGQSGGGSRAGRPAGRNMGNTRRNVGWKGWLRI